MSNIKIVRLRDDSDIICSLEEIRNGEYVLSEPMYFDLETKGNITHIVMDFFLPVQLVDKNEVILTEKDILFKVTPSDDFKEYYMNSVERLRKNDLDDDFEEKSPKELESRVKELVIQAFMDMEIDPEEKVFH